MLLHQKTTGLASDLLQDLVVPLEDILTEPTLANLPKNEAMT